MDTATITLLWLFHALNMIDGIQTTYYYYQYPQQFRELMPHSQWMIDNFGIKGMWVQKIAVSMFWHYSANYLMRTGHKRLAFGVTAGMTGGMGITVTFNF